MKMLHDPVHWAKFEKRLAALRPDSLRKWGTMSVDQMLWHVSRTLQLRLGEISAPRERAVLPRGVMKFLVLNLPWPKGAPTVAALMAKEQQYDFAQGRQRCLELLDRFARRRLDEEWPEIRFLGKSQAQTSAGKIDSQRKCRAADQVSEACFVLIVRTARMAAAIRSCLRRSSSSSRSVTMASAFFCAYLQQTYINKERAIGGTKEKKGISSSREFMKSPSRANMNHATAPTKRRNETKAIVSNRFFIFSLASFAILPALLDDDRITSALPTLLKVEGVDLQPKRHRHCGPIEERTVPESTCYIFSSFTTYMCLDTGALPCPKQ